MVDIETHRVIDIIASRDCDEVVKWLKTYPNLQIISRDGSITYRNAIDIAHPNAIQVSDRFHLLKNLTSYCKDYLMTLFKPKLIIEIESEGKINNIELAPNTAISNKKLTLEGKMTKAFGLLQEGVSKRSICKQLNIDIRVFNKLAAMNDEQRFDYYKTSSQAVHDEKVANKNELINIVREKHLDKHSIRSIAKDLNISRQSVTKYINMNTSAIHGSYLTKRKSILDPFLTEINALIDQGITSPKIEVIIRQKGYTGSATTIRHYRSRSKRLIQKLYENSEAFPITTTIVERSLLLKLLYRPLAKVKGLSEDIVSKINEKYPMYKEIIELVNSFRRILNNKAINEFEKWIERASTLNNKYINSFINGITRDINAVENAIVYEYNNGLAEGSVNKLKVIKRIMYGRCSFDMLRKKLMRLEKKRKFN